MASMKACFALGAGGTVFSSTGAIRQPLSRSSCACEVLNSSSAQNMGSQRSLSGEERLVMWAEFTTMTAWNLNPTLGRGCTLRTAARTRQPPLADSSFPGEFSEPLFREDPIEEFPRSGEPAVQFPRRALPAAGSLALLGRIQGATCLETPDSRPMRFHPLLHTSKTAGVRFCQPWFPLNVKAGFPFWLPDGPSIHPPGSPC